MIRHILLSFACWLGITASASAHKLEIAYQLLPGWRMQVRGWYEGGDPASGARVRVVQADGLVIGEGRLNKYGIFICDVTGATTLNIVVSIAGHRAEQTITADILQRHLVACCCACMTSEPMQTAALLELQAANVAEAARSQTGPDPPSQFPFVGMLIGVAALLMVAIAFMWMSKRQQV
jgi:hypothetical protein